MVANTTDLDIRDIMGLRVVMKLIGDRIGLDARFSLEEVVKAVLGVVDTLDNRDIWDLVAADVAPPTAETYAFEAKVYATRAWKEQLPCTLRRRSAQLAVIACMSHLTV